MSIAQQGRRAIPFLVKLLPFESKTWYAVFGQLTRMGSEGVRALIDAAQMGPPGVRRSAAYHISWNETPEALAGAKLLVHSSDPEVRAAAVALFGLRLLKDAECRELFLKALKDPSSAVKLSALSALQTVVMQRAISDQCRLAGDTDPKVRHAAIAVLRNACEAKNKELFLEAMRAVQKALEDPDHEVAREAANALGFWSDMQTLKSMAAVSKAGGSVSPELLEKVKLQWTNPRALAAAQKLSQCKEPACREVAKRALDAMKSK
jgi:HEAT repeat protein